MPSRRDVVLGGALLATAGAAVALVPRGRLLLLRPGVRLEDLVPPAFGDWRRMDTAGVVTPPRDGSLQSRLYAETVSRAYTNGAGDIVMLVIAYGSAQSDQLQLHRPETCYPAVGFRIAGSGVVDLPVGRATIPCRWLTAARDQRTEQVLYWTRIGEEVPVSGADQRVAQLRATLRGVVPDGVLVRVSCIETDAPRGLALNASFGRSLVRVLTPAARLALLGSDRARSVAVARG